MFPYSVSAVYLTKSVFIFFMGVYILYIYINGYIHLVYILKTGIYILRVTWDYISVLEHAPLPKIVRRQFRVYQKNILEWV